MTRSLPGTFDLAQNYPNPFNPTTAIELSLAEAGPWTISIFNISGQKVKEFTGYSEAGKLRIIWDATDGDGNPVSSGIYLYKAQVDGFAATRKMILMK